MLTFTGCEEVGVNTKDELIFAMTSDDGKRYEFAITHEAFLRLFSMGWTTAPNLSQVRTGVTAALTGKVSFATADMQPALAFLSGPLCLTVPLTREVLSHLQDGLRTYKATQASKH